MLRSVWTPSFALFMSEQSALLLESRHIDPVRSSTTTTSTGLDEHGLHAFARAATSKCPMPKIFANQVLVLAVAVTVRLFGFVAALHPKPAVAAVVQDVV